MSHLLKGLKTSENVLLYSESKYFFCFMQSDEKMRKKNEKQFLMPEKGD